MITKVKFRNILPMVILLLLGCYPTIERNNQIECKISDSSAICVLRAQYPSPLLKDSCAKCAYSAKDTIACGIYSHVYLQEYYKYPRKYCPSLNDFLFKFKGKVTDTLIEKDMYFAESRNVMFRFGKDSCINIEASIDTLSSKQGEGFLDYSWFVPCKYGRVKNYESKAIRIFLPNAAIFYPAEKADNQYSIWDNWARHSLAQSMEEALEHTPFPALDTSIIIGNGVPVLSFYFCDNLTMNIFFGEDSTTFPKIIKENSKLNFPELVKLFLSQKGRRDIFLGRINYKSFLVHNGKNLQWLSYQNNYVKLDRLQEFPTSSQNKDFFWVDKWFYTRYLRSKSSKK